MVPYLYLNWTTNKLELPKNEVKDLKISYLVLTFTYQICKDFSEYLKKETNFVGNILFWYIYLLNALYVASFLTDQDVHLVTA